MFLGSILFCLTPTKLLNNLKEKYEIVPIYITKDLSWYSSGCLRYIDSFNNYNLIEKYATKVNLVNKKAKNKQIDNAQIYVSTNNPIDFFNVFIHIV